MDGKWIVVIFFNFGPNLVICSGPFILHNNPILIEEKGKLFGMLKWSKSDMMDWYDKIVRTAFTSRIHIVSFIFDIPMKCFGTSRSLLWCIWKERNSRIFEDSYNSFDSFWNVLQHTASWWSTNYTKHFCNYSLSTYFNNWKAIIS